MGDFTESIVEGAALAWLESLGCTVKHRPEIAAKDISTERQDSNRVVLATTGHSSCKKCTLLLSRPLTGLFDFKALVSCEMLTFD